MGNFLKKALDLLYPQGLTCNLCGRDLSDEERKFGVCSKCRDKFEETHFSRYYSDIVVRACYFYIDGVKRLISTYKKGGRADIGLNIAQFLAEEFRHIREKVDGFCYVPVAPSAIKTRGYDNMKIIAEEFSRLTGVPIRNYLFRGNEKYQFDVPITEREQNISEIFFCRERAEGDLLIIDDVLTTGSTLRGCAKTLLAHGANSVIGLTFAEAKMHSMDTK